ncbi:hypothetical protein [Amycolatopsis albispora]|uniref:Translation initiation factor 2 n=1 Tax=Amycolatopsis albispora TaxID=1804986 RepID=A0A344L5M3_9PSEU|nr:hypothetical protein [Amycolatopsis albispora]AXB43347.1 hypothetical protein A4R43_12945 [Amycolatopsis albispora]
MSASQWAKVPFGPESHLWNTTRAERTVLIVVHTVTALNRLHDLLTVFDSDRRVQLACTIPGASAAEAGVERELAELGAVVLPWDQARATEFDLAISVHNSGNLHDIPAPLAVLSHGIGYTKFAETGNRKPETGNRKPETGNRSVYGLSPASLVRNGSVAPAAIVLAHEQEKARLAQAVPAAVPRAVVGGDPCFDRLVVSEPARRSYRRALGASDKTTVVLVSSTWGPRSLYGRHPGLIARLLAELDLGDHLVAAALHPNLWYAHSPAQVRLWLADCLRAGLHLVPPVQGWQQALLAADVVIGDHGAVTGYAAALGKPTLLASFPEADVVAESAIGALGRTTPRLDPHQPLAPQLRAAKPPDRNEVRPLVTSLPGASARQLRQVFYGLMRQPEPDFAAVVSPYRAEDLVPLHQEVRAWRARAEPAGARAVVLNRWPADVRSPHGGPPEPLETDLVVAYDHPRRDLYGLAAAVLTNPDGPAAEAIFADRPACRLVVDLRDDHCLVTTRDGRTATIHADQPELTETAATALLPWLDTGRELPAGFEVRLGPRTVRLIIG